MTLAPQLFPIYCATLCLSNHQPPTLNKLKHFPDGYVNKVTWFQLITQVPKY
jgi:hypothetical protein